MRQIMTIKRKISVKISRRRNRRERSSQDKTFTRIFPITKLSHFIDIDVSVFRSTKSRRFLVARYMAPKLRVPFMANRASRGWHF